MGETAWGINPRILEQVQHAYQNLKGGFCGLPLHESVEDAPLPTQPSRVFRSEVYRGQLSARVSCLTIVYVVVDNPPRSSGVRCAGWGWGRGGEAAFCQGEPDHFQMLLFKTTTVSQLSSTAWDH